MADEGKLLPEKSGKSRLRPCNRSWTQQMNSKAAKYVILSWKLDIPGIHEVKLVQDWQIAKYTGETRRAKRQECTIPENRSNRDDQKPGGMADLPFDLT